MIINKYLYDAYDNVRQLMTNWRIVNGKKLQGGLAVVAVVPNTT